MLSAKTRRNIYRILPFGLIWLVFSMVYILMEKGLLGKLTYYPSTGNPYHFYQTVWVTPLFALITGLLIGVLEIYYFSKLFIKERFTKKIVFKSLIYLIIIGSFLMLTSVIANSMDQHLPLFDGYVWDKALDFFTSFAFASVGIYIASILIVTQFYNEVSESIGRNVLSNFFTGKYHRPLEEQRIFMFLDMKASTTIAENLGHLHYFEMLKEYYADLSDPVMNHSGDVYQYVGDEIVVSWTLANGIRNSNCLQCFFAIKKVISKRSEEYREKFGVSPQFKAGFHFGKVTTGEIGIIKKEIIFTGDVLNTAARIQALCNYHSVDILVSGNLLKILSLPEGFRVTTFGENELRGRDEKIELFTIAAE